MATEQRAPVNGAPFGTIAWEEHEQAWQDYHRHYRGQDAETIARRGGFGLCELLDHLGRMPQTWQPSNRTREQMGAAMQELLADPGPEPKERARSIERLWR